MSTGRNQLPDGVPLGAGSPDEPAHTLPAEPSQITKASAAKDDSAQPPADAHKRAGNEEPEPTLEEDLPSDGRDEEGESMIRNLPDTTGKKAK